MSQTTYADLFHDRRTLATSMNRPYTRPSSESKPHTGRSDAYDKSMPLPPPKPHVYWILHASITKLLSTSDQCSPDSHDSVNDEYIHKHIKKILLFIIGILKSWDIWFYS